MTALINLIHTAQNEARVTDQLAQYVRRFVRASPGFAKLEDREDAEQELLLRVVRHLDKLIPDEADGWLRTALHKIWLDRIRKQKTYDRQTVAQLHRLLESVPSALRSRIRAAWWRVYDPDKVLSSQPIRSSAT